MDICEKLLSEQKNTILHSNVNLQRIAKRISRIAEIGMTSDGGSSRIAYYKEDRQAKEVLKGWMRDSGLHVSEDAAGNIIGRLEGSCAALSPVLSGSHLDTVRNGGHFDGVLGVIAALEVAESWKEAGFTPRRSFEVVAFADEEGNRFNASLTGSHLMMGELNSDKLQHYRDNDGLSFAEVLKSDNLDASRIHEAIRKPEDIHAFVELHIEQGKLLEEQNLPVGIVSGIAGPAWFEMQWLGESGHAGGTPMLKRHDALAGAAEWMHLMEQLCTKNSDTAVATVGRLEVSPGARTIIPGEVRLFVDIRDIHLESRDNLLNILIKEAKSIAAKRGLKVNIEPKIKVAPTLMSEKIMRYIKMSIEPLGISPFYLPSGAGHDSMVLGRHIPTGMIFVRCRGGISHNPKEWTTLADIATGYQVLKHTLEQLIMEN